MLALALLLLGAPQDWPSFRGPNATGVVEATGLPDVLAVEENALWRVEVPAGHSSPIVVGDRLVLTGVSASGERVTVCLDAHTGESLWTAEAPEALHAYDEQYTNPTSPTPASDGERLFVLFADFGLVAYDLEGEALWKRPMERFTIPHGMASSPMPVDGRVLLQVDQDVGSHLLALDARTGDVLWDAPRPGITHGYASPVVWFPEGPGSEGVVLTNGAFRAVGYALADGEELWHLDGLGWDTSLLPLVDGERVIVGSNGPPLRELGAKDLTETWEEALAGRDADGDGRLTAAELGDPAFERLWYYFDLDQDGTMDAEEYDYSLRRQGTRQGIVAVALGGQGDVTATHRRWVYDDARGMPGVSSPVLVDGVLFLFKNGGIVTTLRASDGAVLEQERATGMGDAIASPVAADGKVYFVSTAGVMTVLSARADWEVLGQSELGEDVWSTPAIAHGSVYVRSMEALYRFVGGAAGH
jgi:outer membrane protein assembly factor BamB